MQQRRRQQIGIITATRAQRAIDGQAMALIVARHRDEERASGGGQGRLQDAPVVGVERTRKERAEELIDAVARGAQRAIRRPPQVWCLARGDRVCS